MDYVSLGRQGVKVSRICLGTAFRDQPDDDIAVRTIERAVDLGCNFIDCANYYGLGRSERILGRAIAGKRDDLFITSKVWSPIGDGPNDRGLSRFHIMREVERSLERLGTDHIDLYLTHAWDPGTPLDETLRAMDDLVRQGKVRYVGACNYTAAQVMEALWTADRLSLDPIVCLQNQYSLLHRWQLEPELMPIVRRWGLGLITFSPLAIGLLTGQFRRGQTPLAGSHWAKQPERFDLALTEQADRVVAALVDIAQQHGLTPAQVAMAWIFEHDEVTAPIIGPDTPEHVDDVFGALDWQLPPETLTQLDELSRPELPERTH